MFLHRADTALEGVFILLTPECKFNVNKIIFILLQIDVFIYILEHDGSCLAAAINAAGLALADAAVPMYDLITASSIAIVGDKMFVDPTEAEEYVAINSPEINDSNHGVITMSTLNGLKQVCDFNQVGSMDVECVTKAIDILEKESEKILPHMQKIIVTNVVRMFEQQKRLEEEMKEREAELSAKVEEWKQLLSAG